MMNGKGILVICGNSVAELEQELKMLKMAVSTGATMGCGGSTIGGVEQALKALTSAMGVDTPPIVSQCNCECDCCCCDCNCEEDDEDEICPICGDILEDGYCYTCGYPDEDEEEDDDELSPSAILAKLLETLEDRDELTPVLGGICDLLGGLM